MSGYSDKGRYTPTVWVNLAYQVLHYRRAAVRICVPSCRGLEDALRAVRAAQVDLKQSRTLSLLPVVANWYHARERL